MTDPAPGGSAAPTLTPIRRQEPEGAVDTAPCFCCGGTRGVPEKRALVLPAVSSHVRCVDCGRTFNAATGASNGPVFLAYALCLVLGAALGVVGYFAYRHLG